MAENTKIEWADHTFNPWIGCQGVSAACDFCYAETLMDKRLGRVEWGPHGERKRTSPANWRLPLKWNREAGDAGTRPRVFCASLADVFDNKAPPGARDDLWELIYRTPHLTWMLLTKRPENIRKMAPAGSWQRNVWLGITGEDQPNFDRRWWHLEREDAVVRFVSYEPALGPLEVTRGRRHPDWIICGGESGPQARPMHPDWARSIRDECAVTGVPFFFKQWGEWSPKPSDHIPVPRDRLAWMLPSGRVSKVDDIRGRDNDRPWKQIARVGKKSAGRLLDGAEHNAMPEARACRETRTGVTLVRAGCFNCNGTDGMWFGRNAVGLAARHHDATGHSTWAEQMISISYGPVWSAEQPASQHEDD